MAGETPCKICGTPIPGGQAKCPLCGTEFSRSDGGKLKAKVSVEKKAAEKLDIDISDPEVRKVLEELTLLPGISRRGALALYKQGIRSVSDFIKRAMPGEALSERYAQVIANKLAIESAKGAGKARETQVPCPSCRSPNKASSKKCGVCGAQLAAVKKDIDLEKIQGRVSETIKDVLGEFADSEDFGSLPGDMKAEIAAVLASDREIGEDEARDVAKTLTSLPDDMTQIVDEIALEQDSESEVEGGGDSPDEKGGDRELRKRQILTARLEKWRKMGYDVSELVPLVDGNFDAFKKRAKEILASKLEKGKREAKQAGANGKNDVGPATPPQKTEKAGAKASKRPATPEEREKFSKQIATWHSRGYDVAGLAKLLDTDMEEFKRRSMAMLKSYMKKK